MSFRQVVFQLELPSLIHIWVTYSEVLCIPFFNQIHKLIIMHFSKIDYIQNIYSNSCFTLKCQRKPHRARIVRFQRVWRGPFTRYVLGSSDCLGHPSRLVMDFRIILILLQGLIIALSATKDVTPSHEEMGNTFYIVNSLRSEMFRVCLSLTLNFEFIFWFKRFATFPNLFGSSTVFGFNGLWAKKMS